MLDYITFEELCIAYSKRFSRTSSKILYSSKNCPTTGKEVNSYK
jgi:hypothetical protein